MARRPRCQSVIPDHPHHVIIRGNNRRNLVSYPSCFRRLLLLIAHASIEHRCPVHAFVVMKNHVHLVVTPRDAKHLSRFVKSFAQRYAAERNRRFASSGKLFEERFYSKPITSETQLVATILYIEMNPLRAGLRMAAERYPFSSYALHVGMPGLQIAGLWTPCAWYRGLHRESRGRRAIYRELFALRRSIDPFVGDEVRELERASEVVGHVPRRPDRTRVAEGPADDAWWATVLGPPGRSEE